MKLKFLNVNLLKPHEETDLNHTTQLKQAILSEGFWTKPIIIDSDTFIIMDGHHRHQVALQIGLRVVPCIVLSYLNVDVYKCGTMTPFPYEFIYTQVSKNQLLPFKSTKHVLKSPPPQISISLDALRIFE